MREKNKKIALEMKRSPTRVTCRDAIGRDVAGLIGKAPKRRTTHTTKSTENLSRAQSETKQRDTHPHRHSRPCIIDTDRCGGPKQRYNARSANQYRNRTNYQINHRSIASSNIYLCR